MNIFYIAFYTIKRNITNKISIGIMFFLPLILIIILGPCLNFMFQPSNSNEIIIYVYSNNINTLEDFNNYISSEEIKNIVKFYKVKSKEEGIENVFKTRKTAFINIQDSQASIESIDIYDNKLAEIDRSIVNTIVNIYKNNRLAYADKTNVSEKQIQNSLELSKQVPISSRGKTPSAIDYYSVTMLVMVMLYASQFISNLIDEDMSKDVKERVKSLPIKSSQNIIGKILGCTTVIFIQAMFVVAVTKFVYGVNWGSNYILLTCVILLYSIFVINFRASLHLVFKDKATIYTLFDLLIPFFTLLSGGYIKREYLSTEIQKISFLSPSYAVQNIIFENIYKGYCKNIYLFYLELILMVISVICIMIAIQRRNVQ